MEIKTQFVLASLVIGGVVLYLALVLISYYLNLKADKLRLEIDNNTLLIQRNKLISAVGSIVDNTGMGFQAIGYIVMIYSDPGHYYSVSKLSWVKSINDAAIMSLDDALALADNCKKSNVNFKIITIYKCDE
jgi:hypothetical protein